MELLDCLLGDAGQIGAKLKGNDVVEDVLHVMDHDHVLFFTADGVARSIRAHQIPPASRTAQGTAITQVGTASLTPAPGGPCMTEFHTVAHRSVSGGAQHNLLLLSKLEPGGRSHHSGVACQLPCQAAASCAQPALLHCRLWRHMSHVQSSVCLRSISSILTLCGHS